MGESDGQIKNMAEREGGRKRLRGSKRKTKDAASCAGALGGGRWRGDSGGRGRWGVSMTAILTPPSCSLHLNICSESFWGRKSPARGDSDCTGGAGKQAGGTLALGTPRTDTPALAGR